MRRNYIAQAWLVVVLALCFGAALAGVETWLKPIIDENKLKATLDEIPKLVPGADARSSAPEKPVVLTVGEGRDQSRYEAFRAIAAKGRQVGWVVKASGKGFADKIELLIGADAAAEHITGLRILDHKETPGLGNKIEETGTQEKHGFLWPFEHWHPRADRPLVVVTGASPKMDEPGAANKIQAVAGATISSRSVCDIVNEAMRREVRDALAKEAKGYNARAATRPGAAPSTGAARQ
jgi:electron transport complex protein RnfG